jgi:hypothetical protein
VNFLIDECMPIQKANEYFNDEIFKVLDPSCGSGIFLVSALKRMVQWKAVLNYQKTGKIEYPDVETIKRIIRNNIFGVDIEHEATLITIFSLSIALCDKLTPMQIWDNLRFDDLSQTNIQQDNFFGFFNTVEKASFDLVIGNPPFNIPTDRKEEDFFRELEETYFVKPSHKIPNKDLALLFLDRCLPLCKEKGLVSLIVKSNTWLYNSGSKEFRSHIVSNFCVNKVFDFTNIREKLFHGKANIAVCAVNIKNECPIKKEDILHVVLRRTKSVEERMFFEIDHYDLYKVSFESALKKPFVWKTNLLGGGRLFRLINRLNNLGKFEKYLKNKKKEEGWVICSGYQTGQEKENKTKLPDNYVEAPHITGYETIETEDLTLSGIVGTHTENCRYFAASRESNKEVFFKPHLLVREHIDLPVHFIDKDLRFKKGIFGIHAPNNNVKDLLNIEARFNKHRRTFQLYILATSGRAGITLSNSTIKKEDIDGLPYPLEDNDIELSHSENIIVSDVMDFYVKQSANSIDSPLNQLSKPGFISEYAETFCHTLNPIYANKKMRWELDGISEIEETLSVVVFRYGPSRETSVIDTSQLTFKTLSELVYKQHGSSAHITRVFRAYLHEDGYDLLVLVKPNLMRYWLKSIALRDADETFADLKHAGF